MKTKIIKKTILSQIEKHKHLVVELTFHTIPSNYGELQQAVTLKELGIALEQLESLCTNETLDSIALLQESFLELCLQRSKNNQNTCLSYTTIPEGICNTLYFDIAKELFEVKNFYELLTILMPDIKQNIMLTFSDFLKPKAGKAVDRIQMNLETHPLTTLDKYPAALSVFTQCVIAEGLIFMLDSLKSFPFAIHQKIYNLFETYPALKQKIYQHNHDFVTLSSDIQLVNNNGLTPNDMLNQFSEELTRSGSRYTGNEFAANSVILACHHFRTYLDQLPQECKDKILTLETIDKNWTLKKIMDEHLAKGLCVEQAALYIKSIQNNIHNKTLLITRPNLNEEQFKTIIKKYHQPLTIIGFESSTKLPDALRKTLLKDIHITSIFDYIDFFVNLPLSEYQIFLKEAKITCSPALPENLGEALKLLTEEQKLSFLNTLLPLKRKFGGMFEVLKFCLNENITTIFEQGINSLSEKKLGQLLKIKLSTGHTLFRLILLSQNDTMFEIFWNKLNEQQRYNCMDEVNIYGTNSIHCAARFESDTVFLKLQNCFAKQTHEQMSRPNGFNRNFLHLIALNKNFEVFLARWNRLPEPLRFIQCYQKDDEGKTPFHYAALNMNSSIFKFMWKTVPEHDKPQIALLEDNYASVFQYVMQHLDVESFFLVWDTLPNVEKKRQIKKSMLYHLSNNFTLDVFTKIWDMLRQNYYALIIQRIHTQEEPLLQALIRTNKHIQISYILDSIPLSDQLLLILDKDLNGNSMINVSIVQQSIQTFHILWKRLSKEQQWQVILNTNIFGISLLEQMIQQDNSVDFLSHILASIESPDSISLNLISDALKAIVKYNRTKIFSILWNLIDLDKYWFTLSNNAQSLLYNAIQSDNPEIFFIIWDSLPTPRKMRLSLLLTPNKSNILHFAAQKSPPKVWDILFDYFYEPMQLEDKLLKHSLLSWALGGRNAHAFSKILILFPENERLPLVQEKIERDKKSSWSIITTEQPIFQILWDYISSEDRLLLLKTLQDNDGILSSRNPSFITLMLKYVLTLDNAKYEATKNQAIAAILCCCLNNKNDPIFLKGWSALSIAYRNNLLLEGCPEIKLPPLFHRAIAWKNIKMFFLMWNSLNLKEQLRIVLNMEENVVLEALSHTPNIDIFRALWSIMNQEQRVHVLKYKNNSGNTFFYSFLRSNCEPIIEIIIESLPKIQIVSLLQTNGDKGVPLLFLVAKLYNRYFSVFWDMFSFEEQLKISQEQTRSGFKLLDFAARNSTPETWYILWNFHCHNKELTTINRISPTNHYRLIHWTIDPSSYIMRNAIESILESIPEEKRLEHLLIRNLDGFCAFDLAIKNFESFLFLYNFLPDYHKISLPYIRTQNRSFLLTAAMHYSFKLVRFLWSISSEEQQDLALSERCPDGNTFVHYVVTSSANKLLYDILNPLNSEARYQAICHSLQNKIFLHNLVDCSGLTPATMQTVLELLPKKNRLYLFQETNIDGDSVFHILAKKVVPDALCIILKYVQSNFPCFFGKKNNKGETPLHLAAANDFPGTLSVFMSFLSKDELFEAIEWRSHDGYTFLQQAAMNTNSEILFTILRLFSDSEQLEIIKQLETSNADNAINIAHLDLLIIEKNRLYAILEKTRPAKALPKIRLFSQSEITDTGVSVQIKSRFDNGSLLLS